ncbi:MAG: hypothetical protein K6E50_11875 [Lachnospiraceae bacterium]|nr:hypothetical protein [Lachnospiraceae bacterium]
MEKHSDKQKKELLHDEIPQQEQRTVNRIEQDTLSGQKMQELSEIDRALASYQRGIFRFTEAEKAEFRQKPGRSIADILANGRRYRGGSEPYLAVLERAEALMGQPAESEWETLGSGELKELLACLEQAVSACAAYCEKKEPQFPAGKERLQIVQEAMHGYEREKERVAALLRRRGED